MFLLSVLMQLVRISLSALWLCLFGRSVMSWISPDNDGRISRFLFIITEPFVVPVRGLLSRFKMFEGMPFDMSIFATIIIILILQIFLPVSLPPPAA